MSFTNLCVTFNKYRNTFMHVSELKVNLTLINYANKVYELEQRPLGSIE